MKRIVTAVVVLIALVAPARADYADDMFAAGMRAYEARDYTSALNKVSRSAATGNAAAQNQLGDWHASGMWRFNRSLNVKFFLRVNFPLAARWYRMAAEQGHASAQSSLGAMYRKGEGVPQDYVQARDVVQEGSRAGLRHGPDPPR